MRDRSLRSPLRGRFRVALAALIGLTALHGGRGDRAARAGDPPPAPVDPAAPAPAPAKNRFPNEKERAEILPLLKAYLDGESNEAFKHRINLMGKLKTLGETGVGILSDVEQLKKLIYQTRPFLPYFEKKSMPKEFKDAEVVFNTGVNVLNVTKWGELRFSMSLPKPYPGLRESKKLNSVPPFPMIVALHGKEDYDDAKQQKPYPGEEAIKRLFPKASMTAVTDHWLVYAPVWPKGKWTEEDAVRKDRLTLPLIFRHFHVDFDRIVIEGGPEALLFAAAYPIYFAGVIVHGDATDVPADIVQNLANTSVYVVQTSDKLAPAAKTLSDGGHPAERLAKGPPTALPEWLGSVRRVLPKSFKWVVKDKSAHRFAYWMNLDVLDEGNALPTVEAEIKGNTVNIKSVGIRGITLFLNDSLVDLDQEVNVVINGKPLDECRIEGGRDGIAVRMPAKFDRTLDGMFDRNLLSIRKSQMSFTPPSGRRGRTRSTCG